jgi:aminoglycoside 3-N-acetyltransferase I
MSSLLLQLCSSASGRRMEIRRLAAQDSELARATFHTMATVFEEQSTAVTLDYVRRLLLRDDFWVLAALDGDHVVGGLTAHALPMTRTESTELFIYDIAVREDRQRRGIGRALMTHLFDLGRAAGIDVFFVPAENEDTHALDFYRNVGGEPTAVTFFTFER